jgi:hypothetical protein
LFLFLLEFFVPFSFSFSFSFIFPIHFHDINVKHCIHTLFSHTLQTILFSEQSNRPDTRCVGRRVRAVRKENKYDYREHRLWLGRPLRCAEFFRNFNSSTVFIVFFVFIFLISCKIFYFDYCGHYFLELQLIFLIYFHFFHFLRRHEGWWRWLSNELGPDSRPWIWGEKSADIIF